MGVPEEILEAAFQRTISDPLKLIVSNLEVVNQVELIARNERNRSGVRLLMACLLAKVDKPDVDIRKPYDKLGIGAYSGRAYDENYVTAFINRHKLPCNSTTAFLTPALRAKNVILTAELNLDGTPPIVYKTVLALFTAVVENRVNAEDLLAETIRWLIIVRDENQKRLKDLLIALKRVEDEEVLTLSAEAIVNLIEQHLACPQSSRLPVLIVAAAYQCLSIQFGKVVQPLQAHNAADAQTGALGDLEIATLTNGNIVTCYEMKMKRVTLEDIDRALQKISNAAIKINNYVFITTETVEDSVRNYAATFYSKTAGIEIAILDCIGFIRNFLHLFHESRMQFIEAYQNLVLIEPESAVRQSLKESFLTLRRVAETANGEAVDI